MPIKKIQTARENVITGFAKLRLAATDAEVYQANAALRSAVRELNQLAPKTYRVGRVPLPRFPVISA